VRLPCSCVTAQGRAAVEPFRISVDDETLADLNDRLARTRWPDPSPAPAWEQGTDIEYLRDLVTSWASDFNWRDRERLLNRFAHFRITLDGFRLHFVHERARHGVGIPLILGHGWPSAFTELLPLVPLLTDPAAHGIEGPAFDVVLPSLPGYGFSERPSRTGVNYRYVAGLWHRVMRALGYERYGAGGGDFGAGVATWLALDYPDEVVGLHLTTLEISPPRGSGDRPLSPAEEAYLSASDAWWQDESGYKAIQATRPQSLGYALTDSPAGLAAWIIEKWRSWGDSGGDPAARVGRDFLLELLTIYWVTGTITPSMRDYADNRRYAADLGPDDVVRVPTAFALFSHQFVPEPEPPREWVERLYAIRRWTSMPRGGHFAPVEEPQLVARDIAAFFGGDRHDDG